MLVSYELRCRNHIFVEFASIILSVNSNLYDVVKVGIEKYVKIVKCRYISCRFETSVVFNNLTKNIFITDRQYRYNMLKPCGTTYQ